MSMHTIDLDYDGWSMTVELNCTHEGEREVRATMSDPGCPATGPEFDVTAVQISGATFGCPMPTTFVDDIGQTEILRERLNLALAEQADEDAADKYAQDKRDEKDAEQGP